MHFKVCSVAKSIQGAQKALDYFGLPQEQN